MPLFTSQFDKCIQQIRLEYNSIFELNKSLQEENRHLKSEHYKDEELKTARESIVKLNRRLCHYGLTDNDWDKFQDWWKNHLNSDHILDVEADKKGNYKMSQAPDYKIEIEDFSECTCFSIVCKKCGKSHNVYY